MLTFMLLLLIVAFIVGVVVSNISKTTTAASDAYRTWSSKFVAAFGVEEVVRDLGHAIGASLCRRQLAIVNRGGHGRWIDFDQIAAVELTPIYDRIDQSTSQTTTRRGSQLIGAGLGAAVAGPAGLIVGGLSGNTTTETRGSSSQFLSRLELNLRIFDDAIPNLKLSITSGYDEAERLAARLANIIDQRGTKYVPSSRSTDSTFITDPLPSMPRGWWQRTFGA